MTISRKKTAASSGTTGTGVAEAPAAPTFSSNGAGSVTIAYSVGNNSAEVTFSFRVMEDPELDGTYVLKGYVQIGGAVGAGEVFRTAAAWGATVQVTGLTNFVSYTFAARAENEAGTPTAWSSESAAMSPLPDIDYGLTSDNLAREVTGGNVKVDPITGLVISGTVVPEATAVEYYGDITLTFKLLSYESDTAAIDMQFSEDSGANWATATYGTGGDGKTGLNTSAAGKIHTGKWDSYADCGESEYKSTVRLRIRAQDAEGDWGAWVQSADFTVNNRPGKITWLNSDGRTWDEDTTPVWMAVTPYLRGGSRGFPELTLYDSTGTVVIYEFRSVNSVVGWEYETANNTWASMTFAGIPSAKINGSLRMRFTLPAGYALPVASYLITGRMGEVRDWS
jgi:hypothetical protein